MQLECYRASNVNPFPPTTLQAPLYGRSVPWGAIPPPHPARHEYDQHHWCYGGGAVHARVVRASALVPALSLPGLLSFHANLGRLSRALQQVARTTSLHEPCDLFPSPRPGAERRRASVQGRTASVQSDRR